MEVARAESEKERWHRNAQAKGAPRTRTRTRTQTRTQTLPLPVTIPLPLPLTLTLTCARPRASSCCSSTSSTGSASARAPALPRQGLPARAAPAAVTLERRRRAKVAEPVSAPSAPSGAIKRQLDCGHGMRVSRPSWSARKPLPCLHIHSARGIRTSSRHRHTIQIPKDKHTAPPAPRHQGAESRRAADVSLSDKISI